MTVNASKTKVVIFRKGGAVGQEMFMYKNEIIEIVGQFNYLGYIVSSGGSFQKTINYYSDKAIRAMGSLFSITRQIQVPCSCLTLLLIQY